MGEGPHGATSNWLTEIVTPDADISLWLITFSGGKTNSLKETRRRILDLHIKPTDTSLGRYYPWKDEQFVSVTTVIKEGIPKPGLNNWKIKQMAELAAKNRKELSQQTQIEAKEWLMTQPLFGGEDAALLGTRMHSLFEKISQGKVVRPATLEEKPYMDAFYAFLMDHNPMFIEAESTVFNRKYGYAGTLDAIVKIGGKIYVMDYKTGKRIWPEAALQMAAYRHAEFIGGPRGREDELPHCDGGIVVHVRPEGYEVVPCDTSESTFDTFISALDVFRWNRIDGDAAVGKAW